MEITVVTFTYQSMLLNNLSVEIFKLLNCGITLSCQNAVTICLSLTFIDDTHLRFTTISSGDTCVAVKVKKDDDGFYFKVEQSDSISGDNSIELETIDENTKALKIRTIDYKCSLIRTKSALQFVAETGEQVELHV